MLRVVERIENLAADWINPMHGGSLLKEVASSHTCALRSEEFAFEGKLFGRVILDSHAAESTSPYFLSLRPLYSPNFR